jgi:predicted N-formylglutamate amidohydrolase
MIRYLKREIAIKLPRPRRRPFFLLSHFRSSILISSNVPTKRQQTQARNQQRHHEFHPDIQSIINDFTLAL